MLVTASIVIGVLLGYFLIPRAVFLVTIGVGFATVFSFVSIQISDGFEKILPMIFFLTCLYFLGALRFGFIVRNVVDAYKSGKFRIHWRIFR